jgi:hypothetical protein
VDSWLLAVMHRLAVCMLWAACCNGNAVNRWRELLLLGCGARACMAWLQPASINSSCFRQSQLFDGCSEAAASGAGATPTCLQGLRTAPAVHALHELMPRGSRVQVIRSFTSRCHRLSRWHVMVASSMRAAVDSACPGTRSIKKFRFRCPQKT